MFAPEAALTAHVAKWGFVDWHSCWEEWANTVGHYTRRDVTNADDRLAALAGVAEQFQRVWDAVDASGAVIVDHLHPRPEGSVRNRYLAGLWERFILHDLLWMVGLVLDGNLRPRPSVYCAPSWSWASVKGPVDLQLGNTVLYKFNDLGGDELIVQHCEVIGCEVELRDERFPHGRVYSGVLTLRAKMVPIVWSTPEEDSTWIHLYSRKRHLRDAVLMYDPHRPEARDGSLLQVGKVRLDSTEEDLQQVWAVPITWDHKSGKACASGIVVADAEGGRFRRVGFWVTRAWIPDEDIPDYIEWFDSNINCTSPLRTIQIV